MSNSCFALTTCARRSIGTSGKSSKTYHGRGECPADSVGDSRQSGSHLCTKASQTSASGSACELASARMDDWSARISASVRQQRRRHHRIEPYSEFAGLPLEEQRTKLTQGWRSLLARECVADVWVAPAHSFDENTVRVSSAWVSVRSATECPCIRIAILKTCSGFRSSSGDSARRRSVCGPSAFTQRMIFTSTPEHFRRCIREYKHSMTSLPAMVAAYGQRKISWTDRAFGGLWHLAIQAKVAMAAANAPASEITLEADADARQRLKAVL